MPDGKVHGPKGQVRQVIGDRARSVVTGDQELNIPADVKIVDFLVVNLNLATKTQE